MGGWATARIQLCGRFVVEIDGSRVEDRLPGRRGRVLFAYLVLNRGRPLSRASSSWPAGARTPP
jgi:DNA-binding SARP family transcriptional activator